MLKGKGNLVLLLGLMVGVLAPGLGRAAEIKLKTGGKIVGEILLDTKDRVVVKLPMGSVELTRDEIKKIIYTKEELRQRSLAELKDKKLELPASDPQARYALALWCIERKLWEEAEEDLQEAVKLKEGFFEAYTKLGEVQLELGQHAAAVKSWEKTLTLKPDDKAVKKKLIKAYGEISNTLISEKKYAEAVRLLKRVGKEFPLPKKILARMQEAEGYLKEADEHFEAGERHFRKESYAEARKEYEKARELNTELLGKMKPHLDVCNLKLGDAAFAEQDYRKAIESYEGYINVQPEMVAVIEKLCSSYVEVGLEAYRENDLQEAGRFLGQSVTLRPSDPASHFYLALVYAAQGKYKKALAEATQAVQRCALLAVAQDLEAEMASRVEEAKGPVAPPDAPKGSEKKTTVPRVPRRPGATGTRKTGTDPIMEKILRARNKGK